MQFRFNFSYVLYLAIIVVASSCSKSNKEGRYIPNAASFVVHLNGKSLSSKLPWEEIKQSELFKKAYSDSSISAFMKSVLDNPENSGIDIQNDILIFGMEDSSGGYTSVQGTIKDETKYTQFNKQVSENATSSESDGIHFSTNQKFTTAWNKDKFVVVMNGNNRRKMPFDYLDSNRTYAPPLPPRDMLPIAKYIFNLKETNSLGKEEKFTELMKSTGDIHFWINTEIIAAGAMGTQAMGPMSMFNMNKLYQGSRLTGTVNFENGKITADFKSYSNKEMSELMDKYSGDKINTEMVKRIPSQNLAALFILNFKPEGIRAYLKLLGLDGFANMNAPMFGASIDDLIKAMKGDLLIAATDIKQDSIGKPDVSFILATSVADRQAFDKLKKVGEKLIAEKMGNVEGQSIFQNMNEKYFAVGNKKQSVDQYISSAGNSNFDFTEKFSSGPFGAYINFQYILKSLAPAMAKDSAGAAIHAASLKMWDNLQGYKLGDMQHVEINLMDKNTNSLKQMNTYFGTLGMMKMHHDRMRPNSMTYDMNEKDSMK